MRRANRKPFAEGRKFRDAYQVDCRLPKLDNLKNTVVIDFSSIYTRGDENAP